jgi:hypothetical protein
MASGVVFEVADGRGRMVQLREKQWQHIVDGHPELHGEEEALRLTISDPDIVVRPRSRARGRGIERRVNCRRDAHSRYNQLYLWVPIDYGRDESWVVTAYLTPLPPKGELLYVRIPFRES